MKRILWFGALVATLGVVGWSWTTKPTLNPMAGAPGQGGAFYLAVQDSILPLVYGLVQTDSGFAQMSDSAYICVAYAHQSKLDSIAGGGQAAYKGVWSLATSADSTSLANGLNTVGGKFYAATMARSVAVFGNGWSGTRATKLGRGADSDFRLSTTNFAITTWFNSKHLTNPAAHQAIFAAYTTPAIVWAKLTTKGTLRVNVQYTHVVGAVALGAQDSVSFATDVYDSTWHLLSVQRRANALAVYLDTGVVATGTFTAAASAITVDTLTIGSKKTGNYFPGMIDEFWYRAADTLSYEVLHQYWHDGRATMGLSSDSTKVRLAGVTPKDSTVTAWTCTVGTARPCTTKTRMLRFEQAWVDSSEDLPLVVYAVNGSPRSTRLDSIRPGAVWRPKMHKYFDKNSAGVIDWVDYAHLGKGDSTRYELRVYPDMLRPTNYYLLDAERLFNGAQTRTDLNVQVQPYSYVAVYARLESGTTPVGRGKPDVRVLLHGRTK